MLHLLQASTQHSVTKICPQQFEWIIQFIDERQLQATIPEIIETPLLLDKMIDAHGSVTPPAGISVSAGCRTDNDPANEVPNRLRCGHA
jgi:hypothetical protein